MPIKRNPIKKSVTSLLKTPSRLQEVSAWYILSLLLTAPKHSLAFAAEISGKGKAQFSRFLRQHLHFAEQSLVKAIKLTLKPICEARLPLVHGAPWTITIIIDATLQKRCSHHADNVQKFNHGKGFVIGHQWTNIVLLINGKVIPLPPIAFLTKKIRKERGLAKETEHQAVCRFLSELDLKFFVGEHDASEVVVLTDSGYDNKSIQNAILNRGWDFVSSVRRNRCAQTLAAVGSKKYKNISDLFWSCRRFSPWSTVRDFVNGYKQKKRREFRVREILGSLKDVPSQVKLVLSEERGSRKGRKFIACSNTKVSVGMIVRAYRQRWRVELFHKDVKSRLGFEDVSCSDFESIAAHVQWVYVAYLLAPKLTQEESLSEAQRNLGRTVVALPFKHLRKTIGQINGVESVKLHCQQVIDRAKAA